MKTTALITGATGFLGGALARRLLGEGLEVTCLGRRESAGAQLAALGMRFVRTDLEDAAAVSAACAGQDLVFHCGALSAPWGRRADFVAANVRGTANLIAGCEKHGIGRLVHVSTPSVFFERRDRFDLTESSPFALRPVNEYVRTKLMAERLVDAARLETVTLRPRAIFGPGDTTLFPRLLRAAGTRGFPLVGAGDPPVEVTCVENVVDALAAAAESPAAAGKKYNITNGEPWPRERLLGELFRAAGLPWRPRRVSLRAARGAAALLETGSRVLTMGRWEPPLTRYSAEVLAHAQTFDLTAARRDLGYAPRVSVADGIQQFALWWKANS